MCSTLICNYKYLETHYKQRMRSIYLNTIHIYSIENSNIIGQLTTLNVFTQPNQHNFLPKTKIQVVLYIYVFTNIYQNPPNPPI